MKHILVVQTYTGVNWGNHDIIFTWPVATVSSFSTKTFSFSSWKKLCWYLNWGSMLHQYLNLSVHAVCKNLNVKNNKGFYSWAGNNRSLCPNLCTTWHQGATPTHFAICQLPSSDSSSLWNKSYFSQKCEPSSYQV